MTEMPIRACYWVPGRRLLAGECLGHLEATGIRSRFCHFPEVDLTASRELLGRGMASSSIWTHPPETAQGSQRSRTGNDTADARMPSQGWRQPPSTSGRARPLHQTVFSEPDRLAALLEVLESERRRSVAVQPRA